MPKLLGSYLIARTRTAVSETGDLFPRARDYFELRSHALKLAYWPGVGREGETVGDLDWSWIKGLKGKRVGELRIADQIGGHRNLRIIFYVPRMTLKDDPLPRIWILCIMQKKRQGFSTCDKTVFECRRALVDARFYSEAPVIPVKSWQKKRKKKKAISRS